MDFYDVSQARGDVWYVHKLGFPNIPVPGSCGSKRYAMFFAASMMGLTYEQYVEWRKKHGRKSHK